MGETKTTIAKPRIGVTERGDAGGNLCGKKELLTQRHPCGNACFYCYWMDR